MYRWVLLARSLNRSRQARAFLLQGKHRVAAVAKRGKNACWVRVSGEGDLLEVCDALYFDAGDG